MLVTSTSAHNLVSRHLKEEYSIGSKFFTLNREIKRNIPPIELTGDLLINDLIVFYELQAIKLSLFNAEGISIPRALKLEEAKDFNIVRTDESDFQSLVSSVQAISDTSNYSDIEWLKRIFRRAVKKAKYPGDIEILRDLLAKMNTENDKFMSSDFNEINKLLESR